MRARKQGANAASRGNYTARGMGTDRAGGRGLFREGKDKRGGIEGLDGIHTNTCATDLISNMELLKK